MSIHFPANNCLFEFESQGRRKGVCFENLPKTFSQK